MKTFSLFAILLFVEAASGFVQVDTIKVYNVRTQKLSVIDPIVDYNHVSIRTTSPFVGAFDNEQALIDIPPKDNLYNGSEFTQLEPADHFYDLTTYPARTALRMFKYRGDSLYGGCSAIMVSENMALTAAHCVVSESFEENDNGSRMKVLNWADDSIFFSPAFNNGDNQEDLPNSFVTRYYIPETYLKNQQNDIALLKLSNPIGRQLGWVGMSCFNDSTQYLDRLYYKFSYPATVDFFDSKKVYNGDTLYHNYGKGAYQRIWGGGLCLRRTHGVPGQSGSSLLYKNEKKYYTVGVLNYGAEMNHCLISDGILVQFEEIISQNRVLQNKLTELELKTRVYPNPVKRFAVVEFECTSEYLDFVVYNQKGSKVFEKYGITGSSFRIERNDFNPGLFYYTILKENKQLGSGKFMVL